MGAKVQIKNDSINNFGGFYFCIDHFRSSGLVEIIDNTLGIKSVLAQYSYSEKVETLMSIYLTGGSRIEDAKRLSAQFSEKTQGYELCSPDTVLKMLSDQASEDTFLDTKDGKSYKFNINGRLDKLLIDGLLKCGQVKAGDGHIFDYDNQFIPTEKQDYKYSYKKAYGYFPGIAQVDGMPFYIEGRDGNANVKLGQSQTLRRAFEVAEAKEVKFDKARMDCGSYASDIVDVVSQHCKTFYIRAMMCGTLRDRIHSIPEEEWESAEINYQKCWLARIPFEAFFPERGYSLVVQRTLCDGQTALLDGQYIYRCILTNDNELGLREIVEFYNQSIHRAVLRLHVLWLASLMSQQRLRMGMPALLVHESQHRLHDTHRVHTQLLSLLPRPCRQCRIRPQGDLPCEAFRILVRLRPVQVGEVRREKDAQTVHQQRRLPEAAGIGTAASRHLRRPPSRGGGICVNKYSYF